MWQIWFFEEACTRQTLANANAHQSWSTCVVVHRIITRQLKKRNLRLQCASIENDACKKTAIALILAASDMLMHASFTVQKI